MVVIIAFFIFCGGLVLCYYVYGRLIRNNLGHRSAMWISARRLTAKTSLLFEGDFLFLMVYNGGEMDI